MEAMATTSNGSENNSNRNNEELLPLEQGDYKLRMIGAELRETAAKKSGKTDLGALINVTFQVVSGEKKNRLVFQNFLIEHSNAKAAEVGKKQLGFYLMSIGSDDTVDDIVNDFAVLTEDNMEIPFIGTVHIEEGKPYTKDGVQKQGKDRNFVYSFKKR